MNKEAALKSPKANITDIKRRNAGHFVGGELVSFRPSEDVAKMLTEASRRFPGASKTWVYNQALRLGVPVLIGNHKADKAA